MTRSGICRVVVSVVLVASAISAAGYFAASARTRRHATPAPTSSDAARRVPCWFEVPADRVVECSRVSVRSGAPSGGRFAIAIARFASREGRNPAEPIVLLPGGPGQDAATLAVDYRDELSRLGAGRDVVAIDPRGTGASEPDLACPEVTDPRYRGHAIEAYAACRARVGALGVDVGLVRSSRIADDVDAVRIALGYRSWNLVGFSYGARVALTVARDHPSGVRTLVLSSVVPLEADVIGDLPENAWYALTRVFAACDADRACDEAHPDLEARLRDAVVDLDARPLVVATESGPTSLRGQGLVQLLVRLLTDSERVAEIPSFVGRAANRDAEAFARVLEDFRSTSSFAYGMNLSVQCADEWPFVGATERVVDPLVAALASTARTREECAVWSVPPSPSRENDPVATRVPTLVLAGEFDPITPPSYAERVARSSPDSHVVLFPGGGHSIGLDDACSASIVGRFLEARSLDRSAAACASTVFALRFQGR